MINGKRNGLGILKSVRECVKMKAYWKDDKPIGKVIFDRFARFIAMTEFKDGLPTGEFSYYFPITFITATGKASMIGKSKI